MLFPGPAGGRCPAGQEGPGGTGGHRDAASGSRAGRAPGSGFRDGISALRVAVGLSLPFAPCLLSLFLPSWMDAGAGGRPGVGRGRWGSHLPREQPQSRGDPCPLPLPPSPAPAPAPGPGAARDAPDPLRPLAWQLAPEAAWLLIRVRDGPVHVLNATNCF